MRQTIGTVLLVFGLCVSASSHAFWGWMRGTVVNQFDDSDWELFKATARMTLNSAADGEQVNWRNEQTGIKGAMKVIMSFEHDGQACRRMAILNVSSSGERGVSNYNLCQQDDETWGFVSDSEITAMNPNSKSKGA